MDRLNELRISCQFKELNEIVNLICSNWQMYNKQLLKSLPDNVEKTNDVIEYIRITTTLATLNDPTIDKIFNADDIENAKKTLTTEANTLRETINKQMTENTRSEEKGETINNQTSENTRSEEKSETINEEKSETDYFSKFDRLFNILTGDWMKEQK